MLALITAVCGARNMMHPPHHDIIVVDENVLFPSDSKRLPTDGAGCIRVRTAQRIPPVVAPNSWFPS